MKQKLFLAVAISAALIACKPQEQADSEAGEIKLDTAEKRVSYGMGVGLGQRLKQETFSLDVDVFAQGVKDAVGDGEQLMTQEEIMKEMQAFQQQQIAKQQQEMEQLAEKNKAEGEAFLAENSEKDGVVTTESGLQYQVISEGDGPTPSATDTVEVHYAGTLLDGTEFDSSYKRGETVSFPVNGVIPGWTEALQLMPVGSHWKLFIPADLAYGPGGTGGGPIGPNATLIFEVELKSIVDEGSAEG